MRKNWKDLHFLLLWKWEKYVVFKLLFKSKQNFSNYLKYFIEVGVGSRLSFVMLEKCLVSLENARFCSKFFSRLMLEITRWSLEIFLCMTCSTIFLLEIARIEKFKIKNCARDRLDRKFQCSKCWRSMFLPLGLNSITHEKWNVHFWSSFS